MKYASNSEFTTVLRFVLDMQLAWNRFVEEKNLPIEGSVIILEKNRHGDLKINLDNANVPESSLGIFGKMMDNVRYEVFTSSTVPVIHNKGERGESIFDINCETPFWFTVNISYDIKNGGSNGIAVPFSEDGDNSVWYDADKMKFITKDDVKKRNSVNHVQSNENHVALVEKYGDEKAEKIIKFFDELFKDLKETTSEKYPDSVFFYTLNDDGSEKVWMEQDSKNKFLWCRWDGFWPFFENEIGLNYIEIQSLMKTMVEQHLNFEVRTPILSRSAGRHGWNNI
jgi:hypothetical protein